MLAAQVTRFQVGAAATALAAATVLTPAAIAHARPDLLPAAPITNMISTDLFGTDPITGPIQLGASSPFCWVTGDCTDPAAPGGRVAALAPAGTTIFEFTPLSFVPGFLKPLAGWFLNFVPQFSFCFGGIGVSVGPYATLSIRTGAC